MGSVEEFADRVRPEFGFLEAMGFRETGHRQDSTNLYADVVYESPAVTLEVWLDARGEVGATLRRIDDEERKVDISNFDTGDDPNLGVRPPFMFGTKEGTPLGTAVGLLSAFIRANALAALEGDPTAWDRARAWKAPPARLL